MPIEFPILQSLNIVTMPKHNNKIMTRELLQAN